ncbi:MAG: hypothetical protein V3V01_05045 [Acidimicrobiales bacterium]
MTSTDHGHIDAFDEAVAEQRERRSAEAAQRSATSSLWRTHHQPDQYDRCAVIGGRHYCRRCLALHPLSIIIAVVSAVGYAPWPQSWDPWAIWILSGPATIDFIVEQLKIRPYNARRQVAATLLTAFAFGRALGYELESQWSSLFWGPLAVFGGLWFAVGYYSHRQQANCLPEHAG